MIDADLLKILCCPETHQPLTLAEGTLLQRLNDQIASATLTNRAGNPVTRPCDGGLMRKDGQYVYPICGGIPILLIAEAIPVQGR